MPELPEVETLCSQLREIIVGASIEGIHVLDAKLGPTPKLTGRKVIAVARQGKSIVIKLDDNKTIRIHLRMTGRLLWQDQDEAGIYFTPKYSRLMIMLSNGRLDCIDPRRFATLQVRDTIVQSALAPDPIQDFDADRLRDIAKTRKVSVKCLLMDQRVISGIGNIYACEILHAAKIDPARKAADLTAVEWRRLVEATKPILSRAIACRGTTVSDWRDLFGKPGEYQKYLMVYAKDGLTCPVCKGQVRRIRLGGRGTYFCSSCQK